MAGQWRQPAGELWRAASGQLKTAGGWQWMTDGQSEKKEIVQFFKSAKDSIGKKMLKLEATSKK